MNEPTRNQAELSPQENEEQYRAVFDSVTDGLLISEPDGGVVQVNPALCRLLGYTSTELARLTPSQLFHPESWRLYSSYLSTVSRGQAFLGEGVILRRDGVGVTVELKGTPFQYQGRPRLLAIIRDITVRTEAERAVQKSEAEFRVMFENAAMGIALVDGEGHPTRCNHALQSLLGYSEEELRGMAFSEFTHPDDVQTDLDLYRQLIDGKTERYQIEKRYVRKNGEIVLGRLTVSVVRGPDHRLQYAIGMVEDITEKKGLEEQFLRVQRMDSIGLLAGGIAHDLNNVLAPILMSCELLKMGQSEENNRQMIALIQGSAERGAELVKQVLSFARGAEGRRVPLSPKHLIREMLNIARRTFPKSIRHRSDIANDLWPLAGDPTELHQVLLNLYVNARDAMPAGGVLSVSARNVELSTGSPVGALPGPYVVITVADTGAGIAPELKEKIFERFFTTKEASHGTGLGLSTVRGIVQRHGGFIQVQSEIGRGSAFEIWLPAEAGGRPLSSDEVEAHLPRGSGELILVVDDEASLRVITRQILETYGYTVITAHSGAEGMGIYNQRRREIELVLTDLMMPVMDGAAMIAALLKINPEVRIIAASGLATPDRQSRLLEAGARQFLAKPFTAETLLNSVYDALHNEVSAR
ncbi:MAG TPA: PAS domain S-box protein [Verrucomicrobiae bacterium]|jgi:PAS domain S-box-containing protein|nr:PAS domain S-box protein [Verrucomicrobiae bacterium]